MTTKIAKRAQMFGRDGCGACSAKHKELVKRGYHVVYTKVKDGEEPAMGPDAFAQLHCQNGTFPVVWLEDEQRFDFEEEEW